MILLPTSRVKEEDDAYQQWYGQECVGTSGCSWMPDDPNVLRVLVEQLVQEILAMHGGHCYDTPRSDY